MGTVASTVFAARNINKCVSQHDYTRGAVAACQTVSSADAASKGISEIFSGAAKSAGNLLSKADGAVEAVFQKIGGEGGTKALNAITESTGAVSKLGAVAQKAVNPLLCVSSGIRVLKDDDQYAALIEEVSAMGAMFGCEAVMKCARNSIVGNTKQTTGLAKKVANVASKSTKLQGLAEKASTWFKNLKNTSNGSTKQKLVRIGLDILFVAGSICAFNLGHKVGEILSHRSDKED